MRVHFIFVCGKGVAQMAVLMRQLGHNVSGSDTDIYPPVSTYLANNHINVLEGIKEEHITSDIDLVVLGGSTFIKVPNQHNVEYEKAKNLGLKIVGFDELIGEILSTPITIDVVGTYGKSTDTAMLAWVLECAELDPNFMIGAVPLNFPAGVKKSNSEYAVFEGDEHPLLHFHEGGKFMYHKPTHVLITSAKWDHINVYKTEESYIECYKELMRLLKNPGFVVANMEGENILDVIEATNVPIFFYGTTEESLEKYKEIKQENPEKYKGFYLAKHIRFDEDFTRFTVDFIDFPRNEDWHIPDQMLFESTLIGMHNVQNAVGVIAMSLSLGVKLQPIQKALRTFKNVKQRLEFVGQTSKGAIVIDDFAHSPVKAKETLKALRTRYKNNKIIAVFDAHSSLLRQKETLSWLPGTFDLANEVIIPKVGISKDTPKDDRIYGKDIVDSIATTQSNVQYMPLDEQIIEYIKTHAQKDDVVVFMSSGSWRGIINEVLLA